MKQIDDLVASKTFNLDALDGIKKLKDSLGAAINDKEHLQNNYDNLSEINVSQSSELMRLNKEVAALKAQVSGMTDLANQGSNAIWEKKIAEAKANAYQDAMYTVFKPSVLRETVQRQVMKPVEGNPGGNGYTPSQGYLASGTETETITKEQL